MAKIRTYEDRPIPDRLKRYFTRIMELNYEADETVTIPARPTGHVYIGWIPNGSADAIANDAAFSLTEGQAHVSGQLSTFDAEYTLHGPLSHFLAECATMTAYQLLGRNIGDLLNTSETFESPVTGPNNITTFIQLLETFTKDTSSVDPKIEKAVQQIENKCGDINISDLAIELGISDRHLRREFTKYVGIAPKPFALIKKVIFALQTLAMKPETDISDIVYNAGFYDQAHLNRVFQLYMRTTPRQLKLDDDGVLQSIVVGA